MNERELKRAIRLTAGQWGNFEVHHDIPGQDIVCYVGVAATGHAIVRALRQHYRDKQAANADGTRTEYDDTRPE